MNWKWTSTFQSHDFLFSGSKHFVLVLKDVSPKLTLHSLRSIHTSIYCVATLHPLHNDCFVTALQCKKKVKFILTWNAMSMVELGQKMINISALQCNAILIWRELYLEGKTDLKLAESWVKEYPLGSQKDATTCSLWPDKGHQRSLKNS